MAVPAIKGLTPFLGEMTAGLSKAQAGFSGRAFLGGLGFGLTAPFRSDLIGGFERATLAGIKGKSKAQYFDVSRLQRQAFMKGDFDKLKQLNANMMGSFGRGKGKLTAAAGYGSGIIPGLKSAISGGPGLYGRSVSAAVGAGVGFLGMAKMASSMTGMGMLDMATFAGGHFVGTKGWSPASSRAGGFGRGMRGFTTGMLAVGGKNLLF